VPLTLRALLDFLGELALEDVYLVTGCSDSSLRKWDVRSGRTISRMTTERVPGEQTLVWAVGVLSDHTIVSGDSMGYVRFWDGVMGTQLQSLRGHRTDCLCLALGPVSLFVVLLGALYSDLFSRLVSGWENGLYVRCRSANEPVCISWSIRRRSQQ
jgi:WD40 repeat protein